MRSCIEILKKIVIGLGENNNVEKAVNKFNSEYNVNINIVNDSDSLVKSISDKNIDAVVRGSLPASNIINSLKNQYPQYHINRATFIENDNYKLLIAPVGIDEGKTINERLILTEQCVEFFKKLNIEPKIAILAKGRSDDYNRTESIDESLKNSEILTTELKKKYPEYQVKNYYILFEKALNDKFNIILAPDGVIGNILFRSLVLVNKWPSMGAISLGIPNIYIDTSRDQSIEGYYRSLKLAYYLCKNK